MGAPSGRKLKKKKERERELREKRVNAQQYARESQRGQDLFLKSPEARAFAALLADAAIDMLSLRSDASEHHTAAKQFLGKAYYFRGLSSDLAARVDGMFCLAKGFDATVSCFYRVAYLSNKSAVMFSLASEVQQALGRGQTIADELAKNPVGSGFSNTCNLEGKIADFAVLYADRLVAWDGQFNDFIKRSGITACNGISIDDPFRKPSYRVPKPGQEKDEIKPGKEVHETTELFREHILKPVTSLEMFKLGVPRDFFRHLTDVVLSTAYPVAVFFLREVYDHFERKNSHIEGRYRSSNGQLELRKLVAEFGDSVLPEPAFFEDIVQGVTEINRWRRRDSAVEALGFARSLGYGYREAATLLKDVCADSDQISQIITATKAVADGRRFLFSRFLENSDYLVAFKRLRSLGYDPAVASTFLRDYGDFPVNGDTAVRVLLGQEHDELVKVTVDRALFLYCGEGSSAVLAQLRYREDAPHLAYYAECGVHGEAMKQRIIAHYLSRSGKGGLNLLIDAIKDVPETDVVSALQRSGFKNLADELRARSLEEHPTAFKYQDHVTRHGLGSEVAVLPPDTKVALEQALDHVVGTAYEQTLFDGKALFRQLVRGLSRDKDSVLDRMKKLPPSSSSGDHYTKLAFALSGAESLGWSPQNNGYQRIILISGKENPDTLAYLSAETGCEALFVSGYSSPQRFSGIRKGDLVVWDTSHTDHPTYYLVKHLAVKNGASLVHVNFTNKERILDTIKN